MGGRKLTKRRRRRQLCADGEEEEIVGSIHNFLDGVDFDDGASALPSTDLPGLKNVAALGPEEALANSQIRIAEGLDHCSRLCEAGDWIVRLSAPASGERVQVNMIAADPMFAERFYNGCITKKEFFGGCLIVPDFMTGRIIVEGAYERALFDDDADTDFVVRTDHKVIKHTVVHRMTTTLRWRRSNGDICALLKGSSFTPRPFFPVNQVVEQHRALAPFLRSPPSTVDRAHYPPCGQELNHCLESAPHVDQMESAWHHHEFSHARSLRHEGFSQFDAELRGAQIDVPKTGLSSNPQFHDRSSSEESTFFDDDDGDLDQPAKKIIRAVVTPDDVGSKFPIKPKEGNENLIRPKAWRREVASEQYSAKLDLPALPSFDDCLPDDDILPLDFLFPTLSDTNVTGV